MNPTPLLTEAGNFHKKFSSKIPVNENAKLEANMTGGGKLNFHENEVNERLEKSAYGLNKIIENYLDNKPELKEIAKRILKEGGEPLRAVANKDELKLYEQTKKNGAIPSMLEAIVQTDGSRPSFLVKNNLVDLNSSPIGDWGNKLQNSVITKAIKCVGRINRSTQHIGTGFLISNNYIITNRHVLQSIGQLDDNGTWRLRSDANIDFGYEFKNKSAAAPRKITKVIFAGKDEIDFQKIDHKKLDMAILELHAIPVKDIPVHLLKIDISDVLSFSDEEIITIGYPADPGIAGITNYTSSLLDELFRSTYGYKRIAPGETTKVMAEHPPITIGHDATTLAGNSGSLIMQLSAPFGQAVAGLHYGGETAIPRENWGQQLGIAFDIIKQQNTELYNTLKDQINFVG